MSEGLIITSVNHDSHFSLRRHPLFPQTLYPIRVGILSLDIAMVRPGKNNPCTEGMPPPPTCLLCQIEIPSTHVKGIAESRDCDQLLKDPQPWKTYWRSSHKHVMVPSAKVEEAAFGDLPPTMVMFLSS